MDEFAQPVQQPPSAPPPPADPAQPLVYEETPEVVVTDQSPQVQEVPVKEETPKHKGHGCGRVFLGALILLFIIPAGMWLSSVLQGQLSQNEPAEERTQQLPQQQEDGSPNVAVPTGNPNDPYAGWETYEVISGATKLPITGLTYKLPPDVLSPICDSTSCVSQGTYLPGGTRLTIALRGSGQLLPDYRGSVITDANGMRIPSNSITLGSYSGMEFTSSASGRTVSGYAFSAIRGVMIGITAMMSVEVNHFIPSGISADFASDDALFDLIIRSFRYTGSNETITGKGTDINVSTDSASQ